MSRDGKLHAQIANRSSETDACSGKIGYRTAAKAWAVMGAQGRRRHQTNLGSVYRCRYCHRWHVTRHSGSGGKAGE